MYEQISRNRRASWLLAGLVVAILAMLGFAIGYATIGGTQGGIGLLGVFGIVAIAWSIIGYYTGDKMVLAVSGAHRVTHAEEPQLFNVVEEMTIAAGLPQVPAVYVLDEAAPNALATGRDPQHASIAVTRGLLDRLDREELQGVDRPRDVAHPQLRHPLRDAGRHPGRHDRAHRRLLPALELLGRDGPAAAAAATRAATRPARSSPSSPSCWPSSRRWPPTPCSSPSRAAASTSPTPPPSSSRATRWAWRARSHAIASDPAPLRHANRATAHLYIANPLKKTKEVTGVFDTHPPIQQRIAVLLEMAHVGPEALAEAAGVRRRDPAAGGAPRAAPAPPTRRSRPTPSAAAAGSRRRRPCPGRLRAARLSGLSRRRRGAGGRSRSAGCRARASRRWPRASSPRPSALRQRASA